MQTSSNLCTAYEIRVRGFYLLLIVCDVYFPVSVPSTLGESHTFHYGQASQENPVNERDCCAGDAYDPESSLTGLFVSLLTARFVYEDHENLFFSEECGKAVVNVAWVIEDSKSSLPMLSRCREICHPTMVLADFKFLTRPTIS